MRPVKIRSRRKDIDPLNEGTKFLAYAHGSVLEPQYDDAVPGSVKLTVVIQAGQVITEVTYLCDDGSTYYHTHVETVDDVMSS